MNNTHNSIIRIMILVCLIIWMLINFGIEEYKEYTNQPYEVENINKELLNSAINSEINKPKEQPNIICSPDKYLTYTNISTININHDYIENNYYVNENGYVLENETNALYVALGKQYIKNNYYDVKLSNGSEFLVKNVDVKQSKHTVNDCYTTHDNGIVEMWLTNKNKDFINLGNSKLIDIKVIEIKEVE